MNSINMSNTFWLDEYNQLPHSFVLTETLDKDYLEQCLESDVLIDSTRTQLRDFLDFLPEEVDIIFFAFGLPVVFYHRDIAVPVEMFVILKLLHCHLH